jgi:hypothetical protein
MIAPMTNDRIRAYLRNRFSRSTFSTRSLVRKNMISGVWNDMPIQNSRLVTVPT